MLVVGVCSQAFRNWKNLSLPLIFVRMRQVNSVSRRRFGPTNTSKFLICLYGRFYQTTSVVALATVCAVCARQLRVLLAEVKRIPIDSVPFPHRLKPFKPHPAHQLIRMLLEPSGGLASGLNNSNRRGSIDTGPLYPISIPR
ncbi:hypothetical protein F5887DRAFT_1001381 [Amanita rubescens]|nr:hypothetical protein F5887DRAFT_1001381 [Amanita rubescens]